MLTKVKFTCVLRHFLIFVSALQTGFTYSPSKPVRLGHMYSDSDFNSSRQYLRSVALIPGILLVVGIFLSLSILIWSILKCCFPALSGGPDTTRISGLGVKMIAARYAVVIICACILIILMNQFGLIGNQLFVRKGFKITEGNLIFLKNLFGSLENYFRFLVQNSSDISSSLNSSNCTFAKNNLEDGVTQYHRSVIRYGRDVHTLAYWTSTILSVFRSYLVYYQTVIFFTIYGLVLLTGFLNMISQRCESASGVKVGVCFSTLTFSCLVVAAAIWLTSIFVTADFCLAPVDNILKFNFTQADQSAIRYFSSCAGPNEFQVAAGTAQRGLTQVEQALNFSLSVPFGPCQADPYLVLMRARVTEALSVLNAVDNSLDCPPIRGAFWSAVGSGLCHFTYYGISYIWISQFTLSFLMFVITIAGSLSYQYLNVPITSPFRSNDGDDSNGQNENKNAC